MANRLETVCWDGVGDKPIAALDGISHVTVNRNGEFLTDTMLEAHRLNSPYLTSATGPFVSRKVLGCLEARTW